MLYVVVTLLVALLIYLLLRLFAEKQAKQLLLRKSQDLASVLSKLNLVRWKLNLQDRIIVYSDEIKDDDNPLDFTKAISVFSFYQNIQKTDRRTILEGFKKIMHGKEEVVEIDFSYKESPKAEVTWYHVRILVSKKDLQGKPIVLSGIISNINNYRNTIISLIQEKNKIEKESLIKSEFISSLDYEIRTPLNAIMGFSDLLSEIEDEEQRKYCLSIIKSNNEALLQSVNNLLDFYKLESLTSELQEVDVDVNKKMDELKDLFTKQLFPNVNLYFTEKINDCVIMVDVKRFARAISILLDNAVKNTTNGNICMGYHEILGGLLYFYVSDTGNGIELEKQSTLFSRDCLNEDKSQGIGLLLLKAIVQRMGGGLGVKSQLGVGSEFWFTIPYKKG